MEAVIQGKHGLKVVNLNRRKAIREQCLNCSGWVAPEVRNCKHTDCNLWPFRMGTGKQDPEARTKAIRAYCRWCMVDQPGEVSLCPTTDCPLWQYRQSKIAHPPEIKSLPGKHHIEAFPETKKENAYLT